MAPSIHVHDLKAEGVVLRSSLDPDFDVMARPLLGERIAEIGLQLKPMLVIVGNESPRSVLSFSMVWRVTYDGGHTHTSWSHTSFPGAVCGDLSEHDQPQGLEPGQRRVETPGLVIHGYGYGDEYFDQFLDQFVRQKNTMLANAVDLHIDLNAVIFADGTLAGPDDESTLGLLFCAYVQAKQEWYRGILEALDRGQSVAESFRPVEAFSANTRPAMRAGRGSPLGTSEFCKVQAAGEALRWRRKNGDHNVPALIRGMQLTPFVLKRRGN